MLPHRVELRAKYQATPEGKAAMARAKDRWKSRNRFKRQAHNMLNNAVREGRVKKPDTCEMCGKGGRIHGHHDDYSKPLDVKWVCPACHTEIHRSD